MPRPHGPDWVEVTKSSNIEGFEYVASTRTLFVDFKNGSAYAYKDVPPQVASDFLNAESKGAFLNAEIKSKFTFEKVVT